MNEKMGKDLERKTKKIIDEIIDFSIEKMSGKLQVPEMIETMLQVYVNVQLVILKTSLLDEALKFDTCMQLYDISTKGLATFFRDMVEEKLKKATTRLKK